jgi:type I restriction enzyme M protein
MPDIIQKFRKREESERSILVPFEKIKLNEFNLSISRYKSFQREEIEYEDPILMIDNLIHHEDEISSARAANPIVINIPRIILV